MGERTKVFLVDDHTLFRAGIRSEIADRVWICGEAGDVAGAVEGIVRTEPAVVLLDVHMPDGGGRAVIDQVHRTRPDVNFLGLSASDAAADVIDLIRAGARGYVTKTVSAAELVDAIRRVAAGDAAFSPRLAGFVLDAFASIPAAVDDELSALTPRELQVLQLLARGYTYKELAERLFISTKTVESHASAVLRKLQLDNRHQLTRWAADRNIR